MNFTFSWRRFVGRGAWRRLIDVALWSLVVFVVATRLPSWIKQNSMEGQQALVFTLLNIQTQKQELVPALGEARALIFWATWCGPCEIELARIQKAIQKNELKSDKIVAISLGEDPLVVAQSAKQRNYTFPIFADPQGLSGQAYHVVGTPSLVLINDQGTITHIHSGLSPLLIWRLKRHLL